MTISATSILASNGYAGKRIDSVLCRYPKFIHGELMTHRVFSRNASSSRAIPVSKLIEDVERDPVIPMFWGKNQPGMQAAEELTGIELIRTKANWERARKNAVNLALAMSADDAHKQIVNRVLEPFSHINVLITATEWENFFNLRIHEAAQPEMRLLAIAIRSAIASATPRTLLPGAWHLPFVTPEERHSLFTSRLIKLSVARCARLSYLTHDQRPPNVEEDTALYERLVGGQPIHASPAEHQATPDTGDALADTWKAPMDHGNFVGFIQFRKLLERGVTL